MIRGAAANKTFYPSCSTEHAGLSTTKSSTDVPRPPVDSSSSSSHIESLAEDATIHIDLTFYSTSLTTDQQNAVHFLLENSDRYYLFSPRKEQKRIADEALAEVDPLQIVKYIFSTASLFTNELTNQGVRKIAKRYLDKIPQERDVAALIAPFAEALRVDESAVRDLMSCRKWDDLVKCLYRIKSTEA